MGEIKKMPKTKNSAKNSKKTPEEYKLLSDKKEALAKIAKTDSISEILSLTHFPDPEVRLKAAGQLCPCRVLEDLEEFWDRLFEMVEDPDAKVRMQVFHNICDGSPPKYESQVKDALEKLNHDPDSEIRRKVHKVMATYERHGKWNIL